MKLRGGLALGALRARRAMTLFVFVAAGLALPAFADDGWRTKWRKALSAYKKKQYEVACALFESVAQAQPKNGAVWGDLGLCELKRNTPEALAASVHASRMAAHFGDERVRRSAYFNLGLAGLQESVPEEGCAAITAAPEAECSRAVHVCTKSWQTSGRVVQSRGSVAFFAHSEEHAARLRDVVSELDPSAEALATGVLLSAYTENSCASWCEAEAWQIDDSSLILKQAQDCEQNQHGPLPGPPDPCVAGGKRCSADVAFDCGRAVVSHAADSPPIARELKRLIKSCEAQCQANPGNTQPIECRVVHADACSGRVGLVCSEAKENGGRSKLRALEVELAEPEPVGP